MEYFLGIDMGGTNVKLGIVSEEGVIINKKKYATKEIRKPGRSIKYFIDIIEQQLKENPHIDKIGIGLPGMLSKDRFEVYELANIPELSKTKLVKNLLAYFPNKIFHLENDANAAALGEYYFSKKHLPSTFLFITMGTGIGGGLIIDGEIFKGGRGNGVEIGHIIAGNGRTIEENLGKEGIISVILKEMKKNLITDNSSEYKMFNTKKLLEIIRKQDNIALNICNKLGMFLGELIISSVRVFDVNTIIIGGGVGKIFKYLEESTYEKINEFLPNYYLNDLDIRTANLENEAGILGAASLCFIRN